MRLDFVRVVVHVMCTVRTRSRIVVFLVLACNDRVIRRARTCPRESRPRRARGELQCREERVRGPAGPVAALAAFACVACCGPTAADCAYYLIRCARTGVGRPVPGPSRYRAATG